MPCISIIIVNYNTGCDLRKCLLSLENSCQAFEQNPNQYLDGVYVVDNASTDGSLNCALEAVTHLPIKSIENDTNRGFAAACNQATHKASGDYYLFLNPDTVTNPDALSGSLEYIHQQENVGVVGVQLESPNGEIQRTCARELTPSRLTSQTTGLAKVIPSTGYRMYDWKHDETRSVDHVIGAFYLIDSTLFDQIGGFDERFFVFYEDIDLSKRVRESGYEIHYLASKSIIHNEANETVSIDRLRLSLSSRVQYVQKHYSSPYLELTIAILLLIEPTLRILRAAISRDFKRVVQVVKLYLKYVRGKRARSE